MKKIVIYGLFVLIGSVAGFAAAFNLSIKSMQEELLACATSQHGAIDLNGTTIASVKIILMDDGKVVKVDCPH